MFCDLYLISSLADVVEYVFLILLIMQIGQSHPTGLTANLLKLFEPRAPLEYKPPPEKRKCPPLTGLMKSLVMGIFYFDGRL